MTYVGSQIRLILSPLLPILEVCIHCCTALKMLESRLFKSISTSFTPGMLGPAIFFILSNYSNEATWRWKSKHKILRKILTSQTKLQSWDITSFRGVSDFGYIFWRASLSLRGHRWHSWNRRQIFYTFNSFEFCYAFFFSWHFNIGNNHHNEYDLIYALDEKCVSKYLIQIEWPWKF